MGLRRVEPHDGSTGASMTVFSRDRMARGVKLLLEHAFSPLSAVATALSNKALGAENLAEKAAPFRVDIHIPNASLFHLWERGAAAIAANLIDETYRNTRHFAIPIPLIPTQDFLNTAGTINQGDVIPVLEEVMLSFDQGAEAGFFVDPGASGLNDPNQNPTTAAVRIAIMAKDPLWLNADAGHDPDTELFSAELPPEAFFGSALRFNPQVWDGLSVAINPYKTLLVAVSADNLGSAFSGFGDFTLPSLLVSLRFRHELVSHGTHLQNQPSHVGGTTADTVTVSPPLGNDTIAADTATGLQTNADIVDLPLQGRLRGGYEADGWRPRNTHIHDDSVYHVLVTPMFSNFSQFGHMAAHNVGDHPYIGVTPNQYVWEETLIPISWPIEIHHVTAVFNYGAPNGQSWQQAAGLTTLQRGVKPNSVTLEHEIGVALFTGVRSDHVAWTQVAYLNTLMSNLPANVFDRIRVSGEQTMTDEDYQFELVQIPLVGAGGTTVKNIAGAALTQGAPVVAAKGTTRSSTRSSVGGGAPPTRGLEQFINVRWHIFDPITVLSAALANHVYAGVGGNFIVICGKKAAAGEGMKNSM
jgi:hypothetical protein